MTSLPSVKDICVPRDDILTGAASLDLYAASLSQVIQGEGPEVYRDPKVFFQNTYATEGLKTTVREVFTRLTGAGAGSPVIKLETSLGGGKTHTLIALYHLAKHGSAVANPVVRGDLNFGPIRVAAIVGTELGTTARKGQPSTLWGEIARQLGQYERVKQADEAMAPPGKALLRELFGTERVLVLVDEIALYLAKASGVIVGDSTLAKATIAFLQELTETASELDNVSLVITSLDTKTVFAAETAQLQEILGRDVEEQKAKAVIQDAKEAISRVVRNLTPTQRDEFPRLIQHRLFKNINRTAALEVCRTYHADLNKDGVREYMPKYATEAKYLTYLQEAYPFHPELVDILRKKTSSITQFNQTRGVLRLLGLLVQHVWNPKNAVDTPIIHPFHIDFREAAFRDELISRLDRAEYLAAITQDIADKRTPPRATLVDEEFAEPLGSWAATTAFLHSLTGMVGADIRRGANEAEIQLAIHRPGKDPKSVERAMQALEDRCFFLIKQGSMYSFNTEPNLNRIIEDAKDTVEGTHVLKEIENRIQNIYGGRKHFTPCVFANEPSDVDDDTGKPKLVVLHYHEATTTGGTTRVPDLVQRIYDTKGTQGAPRVFANNLVFLVPDKDEVEKMEVLGREYKALEKLWKDIQDGAPGVQELSPNQRERIKAKLSESELFLKVAIVIAHKYLFAPTTQRNLDGGQSKRPLRRLALRWTDTEVEARQKGGRSEEEYILNFLKNQGAARTAEAEPWAPEFVIEKLWPKNTDDLDGEEFKKMFYKSPDADLIFAEDLVARAMQRGVRDDHWYAVKGSEFFDKANHIAFAAAFAPDLRVVRTGTEAGKSAWLQFNCATCKKRLTACTCSKTGGGTPAQHELVVPARPEPLRGALDPIVDKTMEGIVGALVPMLEDREVERVAALELKPKNRNEFARLVQALPQFLGTEITFNLRAALSKKHLRDEKGRPGNLLEIVYEGDAQGFNAAKPVLLNYEPKETFSSCTLIVRITWPDGIGRKEFIELLRDKVAKFTADALMTAQVRPVTDANRKEGAR